MRHYRISDFEHPRRYEVMTIIVSYLFTFPMLYFMFKYTLPMLEGAGLVFVNGAPLGMGFILTTFLLISELRDFNNACNTYYEHLAHPTADTKELPSTSSEERSMKHEDRNTKLP